MKTPNHPDVHDLLRIVTEAQSKKELKKRTAFDFPWRGFRKTVPIMCTADSVFAFSKSVTEALLLYRLQMIRFGGFKDSNGRPAPVSSADDPAA